MGCKTAAALLTVALVPATGTPAAADLLERWRLDADLGYVQTRGAIHNAFEGGFGASGTIAYAVLPRLSAEATATLASVSYAAAIGVPDVACPVPVGGVTYPCHAAVSQQRGDATGLALGLSVPVRTDPAGRVVRVGAGALLAGYSIVPGTDAGSRSGFGLYARVSIDLVRLGGDGAAGLAASVDRVRSHGDGLGGQLASHSDDIWLRLALQVRVGGRKARP